MYIYTSMCIYVCQNEGFFHTSSRNEFMSQVYHELANSGFKSTVLQSRMRHDSSYIRLDVGITNSCHDFVSRVIHELVIS